MFFSPEELKRLFDYDMIFIENDSARKFILTFCTKAENLFWYSYLCDSLTGFNHPAKNYRQAWIVLPCYLFIFNHQSRQERQQIFQKPFLLKSIVNRNNNNYALKEKILFFEGGVNLIKRL